REPCRRDDAQQLEERGTRLRREAAERQLLDLALERLHVMRMAVAHAADGDTGDEVDVLVAVLVDERAALAARHGQARVEREGLGARRQVLLLERHDLARARPDFPPLAHREFPPKRRARCSAMAGEASSR